MGAIIPVALIVAAYVGAAIAVIAAVETVLVIAIVAAIVAVSAAVAATYFYIQGDIKNSMLFSGIAIGAGVGGVYVSYLSLASESTALMASETSAAVAWSETASSSVTLQMVGYAQAVYSGWQEIAAALHLKLLFQVHQIAYLISQDYRNMMDQVFYQVAQVSEAMGYGALTLNMLFENVRTSVLDISTSLGKSYDLSQISWMNTYGEILRYVQTNTEFLKQHPNYLLFWLMDNVNRPGYDAKSATVRAILQGIDSSLTLIKTTAEDAMRIKKDLNKLIADLPVAITQGIKPDVDKLNRKIDDFVKLTYDPTMKILEGAMKAVGDDIQEQKDKTSGLAKRLARPGKYIQEIFAETKEERGEDLLSLAKISSLQTEAELDQVNNALAENVKEFYEEKEIIPVEEETVPEIRPEIVPPGKPEEKPFPGKAGWDVGDY